MLPKAMRCSLDNTTYSETGEVQPYSVFLPQTSEGTLNNNSELTDLSRVCTKKWSQFIICLIVSSVAFTTGIFQGYIGPTLTKLLEPSAPIPITKEDIGLVSLIPSSSKILGSIIFTFFLNCIGRKKTVILTLLPFCLGNLLIYQADNLWEFAIGLYSMGISYFTAIAATVYVVEMTAPHLRDTFGCLVIVQRSFGSLAGYTLGTALSIKTNAIIMAILPLVIIAFISGCPESPYFYLKKGNNVMARKSLCYLYEKQYVEKELNRLEKAVHKANLENTGSFLEMFKNPKYNCSLKSLILLAIIFYIEIFGGMFTILLFYPTLLKQARPTFVSPELGGSFVTICQTLSLFVSMVLTRYFDKKHLMITSCLLSFFPMAILSFFYLSNPGIGHGEMCDNNIPLICIILFFSSYGLGLTNLPTVYLRELIPLNFVAKITFIITLLLPCLSLLCVFTFNFLTKKFGYGFAFFMFATHLFCGSIIFYFFLPKTRNKTLENIQINMINHK